MSEFEDRHGNIHPASHFRGGRRAYRMDGHTNSELRKGERLERRAEQEGEHCPLCETNFINRTQKWCEECEEKALDAYRDVVAFARHLVEDELWTAEQLLGFLDKPWHWTQEYLQWCLDRKE